MEKLFKKEITKLENNYSQYHTGWREKEMNLSLDTRHCINNVITQLIDDNGPEYLSSD